MDPLKKKNLTQDVLYCCLILIFSILISLPLFKGQFIYSTDYAGTLMRLLSMQQSLGHGQWVVRWVPELYRGFGYPVFNFYPPLFYLLGTLMVNLGAGLVQAINLSLFLVILLSGLAMYLFARELWGREGGLVCAVAYLFAPYHIMDLYLRCAAAETASFVFMPLILWSFYKLKQRPRKRYIAYCALFCSGLLLTHNGISLIFIPLVLGYIMVLDWPYRSYENIRSLLQGLLAWGIGLGLAAFFWLPAFVEKKFVHVEFLSQGNLNFKENFVNFKELVSPVWNHDMPYFAGAQEFCRIGLVHGLMVLIVVLGFRKIVLQEPRLRAQILFFAAVVLGGIFLILPCSLPIWEHIQVLQFLQFPFRFLTLVVLAGSVLAGGIILLFGQEHRLKACFVIVLVIFSTNFYYCHPRGTVKCNLKLVKVDPDRYLSELCQQDGGEYIPIWVKEGPKKLPEFMPLQKLEPLTKGGQVIDTEKVSPWHYRFTVLAQEGSIFCYKSFYFPGWVVKTEGREIRILKDNPYGLITFQCPAGIHHVEIYFRTTPLHQAAQAISAFFLILLIGLLLNRKRPNC